MSLITTTNEFQSLLEESNEIPLVVQFSADWNSACGLMEPIMKELAKDADGKWQLAILDVEENTLITAQYDVSRIPDVRIFHKGEVVTGIKGVFPTRFMNNWLAENLPSDGVATETENEEVEEEEVDVDELENTAVEEEIIEDTVEEDVEEDMVEEEEEEIVEDMAEEEETVEDVVEEEEEEEEMSAEMMMEMEEKMKAMRAEAQEAIEAIQAKVDAIKSDVGTEEEEEEMESDAEATIVAVSKDNTESYAWGENCTGWPLVQAPHLSVIEELMPAGASEQRHYHNEAEQFFYILSGEAILEVEGETVMLHEGEGLHVAAQQSHQIQNLTNGHLRFLLISHPSTKDDRVDD